VSFSRYYSAVLKLIVDCVFYKCIGAPLCVEVEILCYGYREVVCFFNAVFFIEPTYKDVVSVFGVSGFFYCSTVRDVFPCLYRIACCNFILGEECSYGVGLGCPLGIENCIMVRHFFICPVHRHSTSGVSKPSSKLICTGFKACGIIRCKIVLRKCLFVRNIFRFNYNTIAVKVKLVIVSCVINGIYCA